MRNAFLLALCLTNSLVQAQWQLITYMPNEAADIFVVNQDTVVVADANGRLIRTSDGGSTWQWFDTPFTNSWFFALDFPTSEVGYACGGTFFGEYKNCLAKTMDGGVTWDTLTANEFPGYVFSDVEFIDADRGFVVGDGYCGLLKTTDGGSTFSASGVGLPPWIQAIEFFDDSTGLVSCTDHIGDDEVWSLHRTADQGTTWTVVFSDTVIDMTNYNRKRIATLQAVGGYVFATGGSGNFMHSTDAGFTWQIATIPPGSTDLTGAWFTSAQTGFVNNLGGIARTDDGGVTWVPQAVFPLDIITRVMMADEEVGYAISNGSVYKTGNGGGSTSIAEAHLTSSVSAWPNPATNTIHISMTPDQTIHGLSLFNMNGAESLRVEGQGRTIDVSALSPGTYVLRATSASATLNTRVVIAPAP